MSELRRVAVIGASGNLGPFVLQELAEAKFDVTIIARVESKFQLPEVHSYVNQIQVRNCDFNLKELTAAFKDQDAVVVMLGKGNAIPLQKTIIDAAAEAGVKRFFPSEFGSNTLSIELLKNVPVMNSKATILAYLIQTSSIYPNFKWTGICNGAFFDWGLESSFLGFNLEEKTANLYGSGNQRFNVTNRSTIGAAIVSALRSTATENKYLYIADVTTSQREILSVLERQSETPWTVVNKDVQVERAAGLKKLAMQDYSGVGQLILADLYGEGKGTVEAVSLDNDLLGLQTIPIEQLIWQIVQNRF